MDIEQIVTDLGGAAEKVIADPAMPPVTPQTAQGRRGYDRAVDALNRLPRPLMALGSLALFALAAVDPLWFEARMQALSAVPEPLWWLLGAAMTYFFGAREAFYLREASKPKG